MGKNHWKSWVSILFSLFFASLLLTSCATETLRRDIALPHH